MNYLNSIIKGIDLEDYGIFVDWNWDKNLFLSNIKSIQYESINNFDFNYNGYRIISKIFNSKDVFNVTFNFVKEKLSSINIGKYDNENMSFGDTQEFLESKFGVPNYKTKNKKNEITIKWKIKNIIIEHSLLETFGLQEILQIKK